MENDSRYRLTLTLNDAHVPVFEQQLNASRSSKSVFAGVLMARALTNPKLEDRVKELEAELAKAKAAAPAGKVVRAVIGTGIAVVVLILTGGWGLLCLDHRLHPDLRPELASLRQTIESRPDPSPELAAIRQAIEARPDLSEKVANLAKRSEVHENALLKVIDRLPPKAKPATP